MKCPRPKLTHSRVALFCVASGLLWASGPFARCAEPKADSETLKLLKQWDGDREATLATLFATGQSRERELANVCHTANGELRGEAYFVLLLIGSPETASCAESLDLERRPAVLATRDQLRPGDFEHLEKVLKGNPCQLNQSCQAKDCPLIDESTSYALVLNGSARASTILKRMASLFRACHGESLMAAQISLNVDSMNNLASKTRNLELNTANLALVMKQSAFFVPKEWRDRTSVKLLGQNENNSRILVAVSYLCGPLCGNGHYMVLEKNSAGTWDYVLICLAWTA